MVLHAPPPRSFRNFFLRNPSPLFRFDAQKVCDVSRKKGFLKTKFRNDTPELVVDEGRASLMQQKSMARKRIRASIRGHRGPRYLCLYNFHFCKGIILLIKPS